jgi:hypothetical protein
MRFGGQTVTFVSVTEDVTQLDRYKKPRRVLTNTDVPGCLFRAMDPTFRDEKVDKLGNLVISQWKCTAPPVPAVLNCKPNDQVIVNGVTYEIQVGARVYYTLQGTPFKCTVICQTRSG